MVHAPFSSSYGRFNLAQDLSGDLTDSLAKLSGSCGCIPVQHLGKVLPEQFRVEAAACLHAVGDTGSSGLPEGSSDAEIIIVH